MQEENLSNNDVFNGDEIFWSQIVSLWYFSCWAFQNADIFLGQWRSCVRVDLSDFVNEFHSLKNTTENHVMPIEPTCWNEGDEPLRSVGILAVAEIERSAEKDLSEVLHWSLTWPWRPSLPICGWDGSSHRRISCHRYLNYQCHPDWWNHPFECRSLWRCDEMESHRRWSSSATQKNKERDAGGVHFSFILRLFGPFHL